MKRKTGTEIESQAAGYFEQPLPTLPLGFPNGWMSSPDLGLLYNAALRTKGDVLEVGPWLGRSTSAIAAGLRDRAAAGGAPVRFDTIDYGITSADEWQLRFDETLNAGKDKGRALEAVNHPGGTIAVLINNLKGNDLLPYVTNVIRGDFHDCPIKRKYGMIFCDATHDEHEINKNMPRLAKMGDKGCIFVFDDVVREDQADMICSYLKPKFRLITRQLFPDSKKKLKLLLVETA